MTREEIAQIHLALQESNLDLLIYKQLAANRFLYNIEKSAIEQIEQNKAAMEILSKEYKLTDLPYHGHKGNFNEDKS